MSQKILASHCDKHARSDGLIEVHVDQVALSREPNRVIWHAVDAGLTSCVPEVNVAYPPRCVAVEREDRNPHNPYRVPHEALALGFLVAQPGAGFAAAVHLERFASPARLLLTDEPRLSTCGAVGTLAVPASRAQLAEAIVTGTTLLREPRSVHVLLSGRLRPFVSAQDASLELVRRGLSHAVQQADCKHGAPVVLEFGGPGAKYLSVPERAILCSIAAQVGAAGGLFGADERSESFLREQRRSKAYRALLADTGALWEDIFPLDLAAVEPMMMRQNGQIRAVREFAGEEVSQVLLGGDTGTSLRDWLSTAALLKSKRVHPGVEFLLCPPSRQILEVLARGAALPDLIATGARLIEADQRVTDGQLYFSTGSGVSLRSSNYLGIRSGAIASAETLAYAVAHGTIGDPRGFKRPVRVTVPRNFPTDDVLLARGSLARGGARGKGRLDKRVLDADASPPQSARFAPPLRKKDGVRLTTMAVACERSALSLGSRLAQETYAFIARDLDDITWLVDAAPTLPDLRAVFATHIPSATISVLSGFGILVLKTDAAALDRLLAVDHIALPAPADQNGESLLLSVAQEKIEVRWLATDLERRWALES